MSKRKSGADAGLILLLIVVGLPLYLAAKLFETVGFLVPLLVVAAILVLIAIQRSAARRRRLSDLLAKYGDPAVVDRILGKSIWVGQTSDQLVDSLGHPADVDEKVLKTKRKEIWKYAHRGGNRYGLRITVENDEVVGWDERL